jgi:hypothetical protein
MKLSTVVVSSRKRYAIPMGDTNTVGRLARYLSQQEAFVDASTLEIARALSPTQKLQDIDLQAGDRLAVFTAPAERGTLTEPLNPGDKVLTFSVGSVEISSRGKKSLVIGKPDVNRESNIDIDLRSLVSPKTLGFISRETLRLDFDDRNKTWFASRLGKTRVLIDELEVGDKRVPISDVAVLRLYRAGDDPKNPAVPPLAQIQITAEAVQSSDDIVYLDPGSKALNVHVGDEPGKRVLNVSENVPFGQIVTALTQHLGLTTNSAAAYLLRLVPPATPVNTLEMGQDEFLYAARATSYALNALILRDIADESRAYTLVAGPEDDTKLIGRRTEPTLEDPELDVDLYEVLMAREGKPDAYKQLSRRQLKVFYRAAENSWWVQLEERASVPVFVNNTRATTTSPIQLTSGDVLSFGPNLDAYIARLAVEVSSRAE